MSNLPHAFEGWLPPDMTAAAYDGWLSVLLEQAEVRRRFETIDGPGIIDPWNDPWMGRRHQEEDEVLLCLAAWLAELN
jgi:hypothetical protein